MLVCLKLVSAISHVDCHNNQLCQRKYFWTNIFLNYIQIFLVISDRTKSKLKWNPRTLDYSKRISPGGLDEIFFHLIFFSASPELFPQCPPSTETSQAARRLPPWEPSCHHKCWNRSLLPSLVHCPPPEDQPIRRQYSDCWPIRRQY